MDSDLAVDSSLHNEFLDAVVTGVGNVDVRRRDGLIEGDAKGEAEFAPFHPGSK